MKIIISILALSIFSLSFANVDCDGKLSELFESSVEFTRDYDGLKTISMEDVEPFALDVKSALAARKKYFYIGGPWKIYEDKFPQEPGNIYYRVMTLDKESLEHILSNEIEPDKASSWDGHYVAAGVGINYGIAAADFRGGINKLKDDHLILNIIFQFDGKKLPWPEGEERSLVAQRLFETIPVSSITNIWAYDIKTNTIHHIAGG